MECGEGVWWCLVERFYDKYIMIERLAIRTMFNWEESVVVVVVVFVVQDKSSVSRDWLDAFSRRDERVKHARG
jgi:hypothetical protein